jgi:sugar phosphate isomerase/epimerase
MTHPLLPDHRGRFPFALGTTSYIYDEPCDNIIYNVERLQYAVDFAQLCLFGKHYIDEFLSPKVLAALKRANTRAGLGFVVHLPMDYTLLDCTTNEITDSIDHIEKIMARLAEIPISAYVLHIDNYRFEAIPPLLIDRPAIDRFRQVIANLQDRFGSLAPRIHIENTGYDLTVMAAVLAESRLGVCMDVGHLIMMGLSIEHFIDTYGDRVGTVHLHGVEKGVDHRALTCLDKRQRRTVVDFLNTFQGLSVIEVFNVDDLVPSMQWLETQF